MSETLTQPTEDLMDGTFLGCKECREAIHMDNDEPTTSDRLTQWGLRHPDHSLEVLAPIPFLSQYLAEGWKEAEHPNLVPLLLEFNAERKTSPVPPVGLPQSITERMIASRQQRAKNDASSGTFQTTAPANRPLMKKNTSGRDHFESFFWKWFARIDIGVPHTMIAFCGPTKLPDKFLTRSRFQVDPGLYLVELSEHIEEVDLVQLEYSAISEVISISGMQRFGSNALQITEWLADQLAERIYQEEYPLRPK